MGDLAAVNWGSVPDWFAAVGTVLTFVLALGLGFREVRIRRTESRDNEIRQARLVVAGEPVFARATNDNRTAVFVTVTNFSDQPIHELYTGIRCWRESQDRPEDAHFIQIHFLAPGEAYEFEFATPPGQGDMTCESVEYWFTDASGRRWRRDQLTFDPRRLLHYKGPPNLPRALRTHLSRRARAEITGEAVGIKHRLRTTLLRLRNRTPH